MNASKFQTASETEALEVASSLVGLEAFRCEPQPTFTWSSGVRSPVYCDCRVGISDPNFQILVASLFAEHINQHYKDIQNITGIATGGLPYSAFLAYRLGLPLSYVRSEAKLHGASHCVEGRLREGSRTILVEDVITSGGSVIHSLNEMQKNGVEVAAVFSIFTYGFRSAKDRLGKYSPNYLSLTSLDYLIKSAVESERVMQTSEQHLQSWVQEMDEGGLP